MMPVPDSPPPKNGLASMAGLYTIILTVLVLVSMVVLEIVGKPMPLLQQAFLILVGVVAGITIPNPPAR